MKTLNVSQMENLQGMGWCSQNTALFFIGMAAGAALASSGIGIAAGGALLYSCAF